MSLKSIEPLSVLSTYQHWLVSNVSCPSWVRRAAIWEHLRPCRHLATSHTLSLVTTSSAQLCFANRVTFVSRFAASCFSSSLVAFCIACTAFVHESFHQGWGLGPGGFLRFMSSVQAFSTAVCSLLAASSIRVGVDRSPPNGYRRVSIRFCHVFWSSADMSCLNA